MGKVLQSSCKVVLGEGSKEGNSTLGNTAGTADLAENKNSTKPQFSAFSAKGEA